MGKKSQIYLSAFIMYLIVGFAAYINEFSNYWIVLILGLLVVAYTLTNVFFNEENVKKSLALEWVSVCVFFALEVALTLCIAVIKVPYTGFFKYFNYTVQGLGLGFAIYSIIRFVLSYTSIIGLINEKLANRRVNKKSKNKILRIEEKRVSSKVEETIAKETNIDDIDTDVEFVSKASKEPEVIGIEYIKEKEVSTPYMEEEL